MKRKIFSIISIIALLFNYYGCVFAVTEYSRSGGAKLETIASQITDDIEVDWEYNAITNRINRSDMKIYQYNKESDSTKEMECTNSSEIIPYAGNENKYSLTTSYYSTQPKLFGEADQYLFYTIQLPSEDTSINNVATFIYKNGITYSGNTYDVKMNIEKINKTEGANNLFRVIIGSREYSESNLIDKNTYDKKFEPALGVVGYEPATGTVEKGQSSCQVEVKVKYYILDKQGNETPISGLFEVSDLDNNQGFFMNNFVASKQNTYAEKFYDELMYTNNGTGTYMYSTTDGELENSNIYLMIEQKSNLDMTFTFDKQNAHSSVSFKQGVKTKLYTVSYSVKTEGTTISEPVISPEKVKPGEKATEKSLPNINGYKITGWFIKGTNTKYDYNTPVNKNIELEAIPEAIKYKIEYVLNAEDAINDSTNPSEYTIEDTIDFKPPTRNGYTFKGWYEDEELTKPKDGISHETGDKKVYAKWEINKPENVKYKVEHYKENDDGDYDLVSTDNLEAKVKTEVTAEPKEYTGFNENKTHPERVNKGTVKEDGSLVLKLYYDKIDYTVSFEPRNNTTIDNQIVEYGEKAIKPKQPVKDGYVFSYWYYIDEDGVERIYNFDSPVTSDVHLIAKWEETIIPKVDPQIDTTTIAQKVIPKTGEMSAPKIIIISSIVIVLVFFGIKLFKLKDISK